MKRYKTLRLAQIAAASALLIGTLGAAQAQSSFDVDLNARNTIAGDPVTFKGSFTYGGVVYGPSSAIATPDAAAPSTHTINLAQFKADTLYYSGNKQKLGNANSFDEDGDGKPDGNVVYRVYRQQHSGVVANLTKGPNNEQLDRKHFVKALVGEGTPLAALEALANDKYTYTGVAFSNFPEGKFSYTVDLASKTGSGSFSLDKLKIPGEFANKYYPELYDKGTSYWLNVAGTLHRAPIVADAKGHASVNGGTVTAGAVTGGDAKLWEIIARDSKDTVDPKYHLGFFGPNAEEVAGSIVGLPERIGGVAIIGKR